MHERLRSATAAQHRSLDHGLRYVLGDGLTVERYARLLAALYGFYVPLEAALSRLDAAVPPMRRTALLERDLRALGGEPDRIPICDRPPMLPSVDHLAGAFYVVEGASLGGQVIAKAVSRQLGLGRENGAAFFSGEGMRTAARWRRCSRGCKPASPAARKSRKAPAARSPRSRAGLPSGKSSMNDPRAVAVDITNCDREPIHIPGAIQPHGVLLSLCEPELAVVQASDNAPGLLGRSMAHLLGQPLAALLEGDCAERVRQAAARETLAEVNPLPLAAGGRACDGVLHRHDGALILEIEPRGEAADPPERTHHPLRRAVAQLQSTSTLGALYEAAVGAVQRLTHFERVMMYRFDEDGHGSVEAEAKAAGLEPYLGLHYPASDIPRQARELYLRNGVRIIPDARYSAVPLVPPLRPDTGAPLDLSFSVLRSVSPVHLEYLANMGVRGSMSISLVVHGRLWGLISCVEHSGPRYVPYEVRSDCELLGRIVSLQIAAFEDRETASGRERRRPVLERLAAAMREGDDVLAGLLARQEELFALLGIDGAAVVDDEVSAAGRSPAPGEIRALAAWLEQAGAPGVFVTDALAKADPAFAGIKDCASGIVSFALPGARPRRFIGFRPEMLQTVDWGGDPRKPVQQDPAQRLHPRRSFALWREEVRLRSRPWTAADREAAEELRRAAVEADLGKQVRRAQRAARARDDLVAVVSHDLKNPLSVIQMQGALLRTLAAAEGDVTAELGVGIERIERAVGHMNSLIGNLLDLAKIEAGRFVLRPRPEPVDEMLEEALALLRPLAEAKQLALRQEIEPGLRAMADRERVFQVVSNLVGNAIKFTPSGGRILLRARAAGDHALFAVTDTGPGIAPDDLSRLFDRYWQAPKERREGSGLGLYIAKGIVDAHGGKIWAERAEEGGAAFNFTLPLAAA